MNAVIIDDEVLSLRELSYLLKVNGVVVAGAFSDPRKGFDYIVFSKPEIVFLDIDMPEMNGIELALRIQTTLPEIAIVFVTAYSQYALDAYSAYPVDFMLKPVVPERLKKTLSYIADNHTGTEKSDSKDLRIKLFGQFEVTCGNKPVKFQTKKSRELLAYLICNTEKQISRGELLQNLFPENNTQKGINNLHVSLFRLRKALTEAGVGKEQLAIGDDYVLRVQDGACDFVDFCRFIKNNKTIDRSNEKEAQSVLNKISENILTDMDGLWITEVNEWMLVQAEDLMIKTALQLSTTKRTQKAEILLIRLMEINPTSELGYQQLLNIFIRTRDTQKYGYFFNKYTKMMDEEFNCQPDQRYIRYMTNNVEKD